MSTSPKVTQHFNHEHNLNSVLLRINSLVAIHLFFYLAQKMTLGGLGRIKISNKTIQNDFKVNKQNISRRIKALKKYNMLMKIPMGYMLNPELVWKGDRSLIPQARAIWYRENK